MRVTQCEGKLQMVDGNREVMFVYEYEHVINRRRC